MGWEDGGGEGMVLEDGGGEEMVLEGVGGWKWGGNGTGGGGWGGKGTGGGGRREAARSLSSTFCQGGVVILGMAPLLHLFHHPLSQF